MFFFFRKPLLLGAGKFAANKFKRGGDMKRNFFGIVCAAVAAAMLLQGCTSFMLKEPQGNPDARGSIALAIDGVHSSNYSDGTFLKSGINTDTNSFILTIYSTEGEKVYDGKYGERPQEIVVAPGGYEISLSSQRFNPPVLDTPVFGQEHTIVVAEDEQAKVSFVCRQTNAGIRFTFADNFKEKFAGNGIVLEQGKKRLEYSYKEKKYAFVSDEPFSIIYNGGGTDTVLLEKSLVAGQMVDMRLVYSSSRSTASAFKVEIDTVREWLSYNYNVGLKLPSGSVPIEEAKGMTGERNVKVFGYIFGGDPTATTVRIGPPFGSATTLVIAPSMSERNRNNMMVVELPQGSVRNALNLVSHPDYLGRPVLVTGTISPSYYGYPGVKNTKSYMLL